MSRGIPKPHLFIVRYIQNVIQTRANVCKKTEKLFKSITLVLFHRLPKIPYFHLSKINISTVPQVNGFTKRKSKENEELFLFFVTSRSVTDIT